MYDRKKFCSAQNVTDVSFFCSAPWRTQVGCAHQVGPLWYLFVPIFFIYCKTILRKFLAHLEMCRIGNFDVAFSGPEFQLPVFSLFV